ncbi:hypothetical protein GN958_ATG17199, partial [Phytophthora infestans]
EAVTNQQAHPNLVTHYSNGLYWPRARTITNGIKASDETGAHERGQMIVASKVTSVKLLSSVLTILAYVWYIPYDYGFTRKILERRVMQTKAKEYFRLVEEVSHIDWCHHNLVFIDGVSFDNRGIARKKGYSLRDQTIAIRGDFQQKRRIFPFLIQKSSCMGTSNIYSDTMVSEASGIYNAFCENILSFLKVLKMKRLLSIVGGRLRAILTRLVQCQRRRGEALSTTSAMKAA